MTRFQIILPLAAAAIAAATANAQSYAITRSLVGTTAQFTSTPGSYALRSNAGQSAATAPRVNVSANYTNGLGFWASARTPTPGCIADVDDGSFTGTRDGGVTIDDLLYYLFIFDQGLLAADVDDGSFTGTPDGGVTIDDLLFYLFRFDSGC